MSLGEKTIQESANEEFFRTILAPCIEKEVDSKTAMEICNDFLSRLKSIREKEKMTAEKTEKVRKIIKKKAKLEGKYDKDSFMNYMKFHSESVQLSKEVVKECDEIAELWKIFYEDAVKAGFKLESSVTA